MNLFLIGNGFDLHYCLPTSYTCFLDVVEYLNELMDAGETVTSVAQVLACERLCKGNRAIRSCVEQYGANYDAPLDPDTIKMYFGNARNNLWFSYLRQSLDPDKNWIDFESEIRNVIDVLLPVINQDAFHNVDPYIKLSSDDQYSRHICSCFQFFYDADKENQTYLGSQFVTYPVMQGYYYMEPYGSGRKVIYKTKIAGDLFKELKELEDMLAAYLTLFVDEPVRNLVINGYAKYDYWLGAVDWNDTQVISLNYTHTIQSLYYSEDPYHPRTHYIHGELNELGESNIVLGVSSDDTDELASTDVTFIQFKKYYQRIFYKTDLSYISFTEYLNNTSFNKGVIHLYVIGSSLDKTDQEIIKECFLHANSICIFYHEESAVNDYIRNLVMIYGKKEFDRLRTEKHLSFEKLSALSVD